MCRHLAYVGPPIPVAGPLLDAPHSLAHQSHAAGELLVGTVAADGFGAAWYVDGAGDRPVVFRSTLPIWADRSFASVARASKGRAIIANVRNATEAGTNDACNVHPFDAGQWTFSHNGYVEDFRAAHMRDFRRSLSDARYAGIRGCTDSETVFAMILSRLDAGERPIDALAAVCLDVIARADAKAHTAQLSLLLSDGAQVFGARTSNRARSNSLYTRSGGGPSARGSFVASERLDQDSGWRAVPEHCVFTLHAGEPVDVRSIR